MTHPNLIRSSFFLYLLTSPTTTHPLFTFSASNNLIIITEMPLSLSPRVHGSPRRHGRGTTHHVSSMGHEDGEVGQVTAGASGVALVGFQ